MSEWQSRTGVEKRGPPRPSLEEVLRLAVACHVWYIFNTYLAWVNVSKWSQLWDIFFCHFNFSVALHMGTHKDRREAVEARLGLLQDQRERFRKLLRGLAGVVSSTLDLSDDCYIGGSFGRNTALNYCFDADLVVFIEDFDPSWSEWYQESLYEGLEGEFRRGVKIAKMTPFSMKLCVGTYASVWKLRNNWCGDHWRASGVHGEHWQEVGKTGHVWSQNIRDCTKKDTVQMIHIKHQKAVLCMAWPFCLQVLFWCRFMASGWTNHEICLETSRIQRPGATGEALEESQIPTCYLPKHHLISPGTPLYGGDSRECVTEFARPFPRVSGMGGLWRGRPVRQEPQSLPWWPSIVGFSTKLGLPMAKVGL